MYRLLQSAVCWGLLTLVTASWTPKVCAQLSRLPYPRVSRAEAGESAAFESSSLSATRPYANIDSFLAPAEHVETDLFYEDLRAGESSEQMFWQALPNGFIYRSYLAGVKESRLGVHLINEHGALMDGTMGGRFGVMRYGNANPYHPRGFQVDVEASGQIRLDIEEEVDVHAVDFRAGVPFTFGNEIHQTKFAYYHLSSHIGDEFLIKNPTFNRLNFSRDVLVLGQSYFMNPQVRIYAEAGWAFYSDVAQEWEFQFGLDYAPDMPTGFHGAPFFAFNSHLREEVNFGGNVSVQAGWAWRGRGNAHLLRIGLHYYNGESSQFSLFDQFEHQVGLGIWYDF